MKVGLLAYVILIKVVWCQDPLVMTTNGLVRGSRANTGAYSEFMGIPYASVDPDNLFGVSLPYPKFDGVFEAHDSSAACPQRDQFTGLLIGSLDCLTVNVYVPATASIKNPLPVMVWFYGDGFRTGYAGQSLYGPQYLVRHEVILVMLNYRLGPYGFMCLDIPSVPGNAGLKDQQAALRWVNENIEAFGGNSSSITIFGDDAGAASVEYHILSAGSGGLFQRAILQSGSVLSDLFKNSQKISTPFELSEYLGFHTEIIEEALAHLNTVTTDELITAAEELKIRYQPCLEKQFESVDSFLSNSPQYLLASREYDSVPLLLGYTDNEQSGQKYDIKIIKNYFEQHKNEFFDRLYENFQFPNLEEVDRAATILKNFYLGSKDISHAVDEFENFLSDFSIAHPMERTLLYHLGNSNIPVYQYVFSFSGSQNFLKWRLNVTEGGAAYSDEIRYLFQQNYIPPLDPQDEIIIDRMTTMWTNFAKYGDPTPEVTELLPVRWPAVTKASRNYLLIDSQMEVSQRAFHERMAFWDLFYVAFGKYQRSCA